MTIQTIQTQHNLIPQPLQQRLAQNVCKQTIREKLHKQFGKRACLWQLKVAEVFLKKAGDVVCIAGTGMGKTLAFWSPLALTDTGVQIVVTPLNQLGHQSVTFLGKAGIKGISISAETASLVNFRDIEDMRYRAIITSPEQLVKPGGEFEKLLQKPTFALQIMGFVFDEAHCITSWGEFCNDYKELEHLRLLHMRSENLLMVHMSTDKPNIKICVHKIRYSLSSYADLGFLVPTGWTPGDQKIKWFNSDMTSKFKEVEVDNLITGDTWGLCMTESFGMGMDVPDIILVIQWRATCSLSTVWQRFGRAVRNRALQGTALLFAEKEHFDDVHEEKQKRQQNKKRKAADTPQNHTEPDGNIVMGAGDSVPNDTLPVGNASVSDAQLKELMKPNTEVASKQKKQRELDPAMDWLINAHLRGIGCRHKVSSYDGSDTANTSRSAQFMHFLASILQQSRQRHMPS
ncbi:P-loop containing nucleoside triphosphate hydrolase protein [Suillus placidus]|uniref:DNA 3'-5' helicase n=1 Tax=Suillus placidus TaxID=48579 RepID=A0A9P6ZHZ5_9AGAM|nr:P-loop containing nucleoside triphosphate hydrolase protein [Suillus placidus]